jgi:hypothetical protein
LEISIQVELHHLDPDSMEMDLTAFVPSGTWDIISGKGYINKMAERNVHPDLVEWYQTQSNKVPGKYLRKMAKYAASRINIR